MPQFRYKVVREDGSTRKGVVEAKDRFSVYSQIRNEGETIVSVEEAGGVVRNFDVMAFLNSFFSRVKMEEKILLSRNLAAMLEAGLSLSRALSVLERQTRNARLKKALVDVVAEVAKGSPLHEALKLYPDIFSPLFVSMVRAGEESGGLGDALRVVSKQMERSYTLSRKIKGAMLYPGIIVTAMIGIGILMLIYVVPTLTQTFTELNVELPVATKIVIGASNFLVEHTLITLLLMAFVVGGVIAFLRTRVGKMSFDFVMLHTPIIGNLVKETNSARTARTLGSLLASGVDMLHALSITEEVVQNAFYQKVLRDVQQAAEQGGTLGKIFSENEHLYPILVGEMVTVGEETGKLSDMLEQVASFYEDEVEQKTKDLSTIIEPFLMVFIGAVVGFFAMAMIAPIYSLSEGIQ